MNRYEDFLSRIEVHQEALRDARDDLVGSRFRLRTKRQELRATEEATASRMRSTFDLMRTLLLKQGLNVPEEVHSAWADVDTMRDTLGEQEVGYEQAEKDYNLEEWQYTEKERDFLEHISRDTPLSEAPVAKFPPPDFSGRPIEFPYTSMEVGAISTTPEQSISFPTIVDFRAPVGTQFDDLEIEQLSRSTSAQPTTKVGSDIPHIDQAYCDSPSSLKTSKWSKIRQMIDDWMLGCLESSPLQRRWLESLVPEMNLNDEQRWILIKQHWRTDSPHDSTYHTGDTTIHGSTISEAISVDDDQNSFYDDSLVTDSDTGPSSIHPLLPDDRVAGTLASFDNPSKIKTSDLERHVKFQLETESSKSVSTQPTVMHLSSSHGEDHSSLAPESFQSSTATDSRVSYHPDRPSSTQFTERPAGSSFSELDPSSSFLEIDETYQGPSLGITGLERSQLDEKRSDISNTAELAVPESPDTHLEYKNPDTLQNKGMEYICVSPPAVVFQNSAMLDPDTPTLQDELSQEEIRDSIYRSRSHTRHPFAPFIRVKSPQPWSLPLLRLTPLPTPLYASSDNDGRLENIPFVTISDTPFRLPGPFSSPPLYCSTMPRRS